MLENRRSFQGGVRTPCTLPLDPPLRTLKECDDGLFLNICDPPQDFNAKGESTRTTRFYFKTKEFILTRFRTLAILPH